MLEGIKNTHTAAEEAHVKGVSSHDSPLTNDPPRARPRLFLCAPCVYHCGYQVLCLYSSVDLRRLAEFRLDFSTVFGPIVLILYTSCRLALEL